MLIRLSFVALAALATAAAAAVQPAVAAPSGTADQALHYDSAFAAYSAYRDENVAEWRAVNDEVARVGGHAGVVGGAHGHAAGTPAAPSQAEAGQPAMRIAPQTPAGAHSGHH